MMKSNKITKCLRAACFLFAAYASWAVGNESKEVDVQYRQAVIDARAGRNGPAINALRSLQAQFPERQDILCDYAVVLGWVGDDATALLLIDKIRRADAPSYVIEGLAGSARRLKRFELAESLYREAMARPTGRLEAKIGLALVLADQGKLDEATAIVANLQAQFRRRVDVLEASAEIAGARCDYFAALATYQNILAQEPGNRVARRGRIMSLARIGAPGLAVELAERSPDLLDQQERDTLAADRTAIRIRWGAIAADRGRGVAGTDRAVQRPGGGRHPGDRMRPRNLSATGPLHPRRHRADLRVADA